MAFYNVKNGNLTPVAGGTLYADCPVGTILAYGGATPPAGWFICDGTALNRTSFAELFSVIGTSFGTGNGSTTFNIPDMREMVPRGAGTQQLKTVGTHNAKNVGEFQDDRIQNHTHGLSGEMPYYQYTPLNGHFDYNVAANGNCAGTYATVGISSGLGYRAGDTTEVKSIGVNYIIKATRIAVPADFMASVHDAMNDSVVTEVTGRGDTGCSFIAHKKNGVVTLNINSTTALSNTQHLFGTLPIGYRPGLGIRIIGWTADSYTYQSAYALGSVSTSGAIYVTCATEQARLVASATFIAEN